MEAPSAPALALLRDCSIEISPKDELTGPGLRVLFDSGTIVFVNNPPGVTHHDIVAACKRLREAGFVAVPHVVARHLTGFTQASDFLARVVGEAGVDEILLLGGDVSRPEGPFASALDVLATGVVERHGVGRVAFAGYPEGHPLITTARLDAALRAKIELARARGLDISLVTQFGFEVEPILHWILAQRAAGVTCPIRVGVAGPASVATLAKFAIRCGIGASLRALSHRHAAIARILTEANPGALIEALAGRIGSDAGIGLHMFCFGGSAGGDLAARDTVTRDDLRRTATCRRLSSDRAARRSRCPLYRIRFRIIRLHPLLSRLIRLNALLGPGAGDWPARRISRRMKRDKQGFSGMIKPGLNRSGLRPTL